jgi:hypothetical protein
MNRSWVVIVVLLQAGCGVGEVIEGEGRGGRGKTDTGWVSPGSFEVEGRLTGQVRHAATGDFKELATDRALQEQLIDTQVKFGKMPMKHREYHLSQLAGRIDQVSVKTDGDQVTLSYVATVDLIRHRETDAALPALEELDPRRFSLDLPLDPVEAYAVAGMKCFEDSCEYPIEEKNFFYCFQPDKPGCAEALPLARTSLELTRLYPPAGTPYPEYDRLLGKLDDGSTGFKAALLPTLGDDEAHYTFDPLKTALEGLGLEGELSKDGTYLRYTWQRDGATMIIDLYDPQVLGDGSTFIDTFHQALAGYQFILYGGHSQYGTRPLLSQKSWFSSNYQIVMMESCRSYAYYARQVFRAKATAQEPTGFVNADVIATGLPSTFGNIMRLPVPILGKLMDGISAVARGDEHAAPSWLDILSLINANDYDDVWHGVAGARTNAWQPAD